MSRSGWQEGLINENWLPSDGHRIGQSYFIIEKDADDEIVFYGQVLEDITLKEWYWIVRDPSKEVLNQGKVSKREFAKDMVIETIDDQLDLAKRELILKESKMTNKEFVESKGMACPQCKSLRIKGPFPSSPEIACICKECDFSWRVSYRMTGYKEVI